MLARLPIEIICATLNHDLLETHRCRSVMIVCGFLPQLSIDDVVEVEPTNVLRVPDEIADEKHAQVVARK